MFLPIEIYKYILKMKYEIDHIEEEEKNILEIVKDIQLFKKCKGFIVNISNLQKRLNIKYNHWQDIDLRPYLLIKWAEYSRQYICPYIEWICINLKEYDFYTKDLVYIIDTFNYFPSLNSITLYGWDTIHKNVDHFLELYNSFERFFNRNDKKLKITFFMDNTHPYHTKFEDLNKGNITFQTSDNDWD
jgi:hypothetical protein